jgi:tetratricopeptide (TPR) repeat protein
LESAPRNYFALLNRAAYLVEGDAQQLYGWSKRFRLQLARDDLRQATAIAPNDPDVWQNFGIVLTKLGEDAKAEEALKRAVHLAPARATLYNDWGNLYLRRGDWQKALRNYNIALQLKPASPDALFNRALLFEWMRRNLPPASEKPGPERAQ